MKTRALALSLPVLPVTLKNSGYRASNRESCCSWGRGQSRRSCRTERSRGPRPLRFRTKSRMSGWSLCRSRSCVTRALLSLNLLARSARRLTVPLSSSLWNSSERARALATGGMSNSSNSLGRNRFLASPRSMTKPLRILPLQVPLGSH